MAKTDKGNNGGQSEGLLPEEVIRHVPMTDIFIDYDWNVRSKAEVFSDTPESDGDNEKTTVRDFSGLCLNIFLTGQDDPVVLRRVEGGKSLGGKATKCPLELVCGFRRASAVLSLNQADFRAKLAEKKENKEAMARRTNDGKPIVPNTADGTIRAVIRVLTPAEAVILNAKENTLRSNLTTPDMVNYLSRQLRGGKYTQVALAAALGVGQPYVSRLARICSLPELIIQHWRGDSVKVPGMPNAVQKRLTYREMVDLAEVAKNDNAPGETYARYVAMLVPQGAADGGDADKADPAEKRIKELFDMAGRLCKLGILEPASMIPASLAAVIGPKKDGFLIDCGKADLAKRIAYCDLAVDAFYAGMGEPRPKGRKSARKEDEPEADGKGETAPS